MVDDEPSFAQSMALLLKSKGYNVTVVLDGKKALEMIKKDPPNVVFLDIIMPDMDGRTILKRIREFNPTLPIIMMSGYLQDSKVEKKMDIYNGSEMFYKGDDFSKALELLESVLKTD